MRPRIPQGRATGLAPQAALARRSPDRNRLPGRSALIRDAVAYGAILTQGVGSVGSLEVETPSLIRYGQMTSDEFFVTAPAAQEGVRIVNRSASEPLVMLKHFGPGNPEAAKFVQ